MNKQKKKNSNFIWLMGVFIISVSLVLFCQFYFGNTINDKTTFYENTHINGINVSGLTKAQASNILNENLIKNKDNLKITLKSNSNEWQISGDDFEYVGNINKTLDNVMKVGREGNIFQKKKIEKKIKDEGLFVSVPYQNIYGGMENVVQKVVAQVECEPSEGAILFDPNSDDMFSLSPSKSGLIVNKSLLEENINNALEQNLTEIELPLQEVLPQENLQEMIDKISLRSSFSTDISRSNSARKNNIKKALDSFNGMIVESGKEVSFNETTGLRTASNGYENANVIINGSYISGVGGGVCQASTTLYNALLRSDIDILQVCHHSLPASYVPLSFDAMVSEGYADLKFKNNLDTPIFIKAYCTDTKAVVEIYGEKLEDGLSIETKSELVKIIAHQGDTILKDTNGEYENKVLYKGEYYRLKYPQEGYETKGYIQYIKNGEVIREKEVRHDRYISQQGIIIEGVEQLEDGMSLPNNNVKYIPPQKVTKENILNAKKRWGLI